MKPILPLAAALVALASAGSVADPAAPALRTSPGLAQGVQAFPRLDGNTKAAVAINRALDEADAQVAEEAKSCVEDSDGKGSWNRNVEVTLKSARFISFLGMTTSIAEAPIRIPPFLLSSTISKPVHPSTGSGSFPVSPSSPTRRRPLTKRRCGP